MSANSKLNEMVEALFHQYDLDKNQTLDASEIRPLLEKIYAGHGQKVSDADVKKFIENVDADNDGKVSKKELLEVFKELMANPQALKKFSQ
jgi:Ca2+-binding EF-hand superfamily protein